MAKFQPPKQMPVAPPRGERGLKFFCSSIQALFLYVAPPRGERGLK